MTFSPDFKSTLLKFFLLKESIELKEVLELNLR